MMETNDKVIAWIKANVLIAVLVAIGAVLLIFPKILGTTRRRRRRLAAPRRITRRRKSLPRSVGIRRRNKPAQLNKNGSRKKAWQVKGSRAARLHMARIRRMR